MLQAVTLIKFGDSLVSFHDWQFSSVWKS